MSKIISVWKRNGFELQIKDLLARICKNLAPDNILPNPPYIEIRDNWAFGIMNPVESIKTSKNGVLMGVKYEESEDWDVVGSKAIDGSFALFRNNSSFAEVCSDFSGSRSIWYYFDENQFVASTSQRAIIMYLGNFHFDERVISWMLSTGTLGPNLSWDKRITLLPPDSIIQLDKEIWSIDTHTNQLTFLEIHRSDSEHEKLLLESIKETFKNIRIDLDNWAITLSGGKDSRGILIMLKNYLRENIKIKTFTYGAVGEDKIKNTDGYIAKKISEKYGVPNDFFITNTLDEINSLDLIYNRIFKSGEGRVDHFGSYLDGMNFWKHLFDTGVEGIFRGDVGFGNTRRFKFTSSKEVHYFGQSYLCNEWGNLSHLEQIVISKQAYPKNMVKLENESFNTYFERFYANFRMPLVMAALSDFKLSYIEVASPLLSKKILRIVRELPDHLRIGSVIWKKYLLSYESDIPYAGISSYDNFLNEMGKNNVRNFQINAIQQSPFLPDYLKNLANFPTSTEKGLKSKLTKLVRSSKVKYFFSKDQRFLIWKLSQRLNKKPKLAKEKLINRIFIIGEMQKLLTKDSLVIQKH